MALAQELFWNYSFFRTLMSALLGRMGLRSSNPESPGPHASPKTQIAVTCEVRAGNQTQSIVLCFDFLTGTGSLPGCVQQGAAAHSSLIYVSIETSRGARWFLISTSCFVSFTNLTRNRTCFCPAGHHSSVGHEHVA